MSEENKATSRQWVVEVWSKWNLDLITAPGRRPGNNGKG